MTKQNLNPKFFIGIDIGKDFFDIHCHDNEYQKQFPNNLRGFKEFSDYYKDIISESFIVLEATGGYENNLLAHLLQMNLSVHKADPYKAKCFIRSLGQKGKTDQLDAKALARYGYERHDSLSLQKAQDQDAVKLKILAMRRDDLISMRTMETNRLKHPNYSSLKKNLRKVIEVLDKQIKQIEDEMEGLISESESISHKIEIMCSIKGIGKNSACKLLAFMPELGSLTKREVASLAGCAPHPKDSGKTNGYRSTKGSGRVFVKRALFMPAMSAIRHDENLKEFYDRLVGNGKKPMVALTAVMRKLIVIANAKIRNEYA